MSSRDVCGMSPAACRACTCQCAGGASGANECGVPACGKQQFTCDARLAARHARITIYEMGHNLMHYASATSNKGLQLRPMLAATFGCRLAGLCKPCNPTKSAKAPLCTAFMQTQLPAACRLCHDIRDLPFWWQSMSLTAGQ